jgi:type VI secretion system protein ImpB
MPAESKAKVIERNRAPRVQIAYDVETYGSPTTIELPFVMGVMADLSGASQTREAAKTVLERSFVETDANRFPKFMEALGPRVKARVKNTLPQAEGQERDWPRSSRCGASSRNCSASWTVASMPKSASPSC